MRRFLSLLLIVALLIPAVTASGAELPHRGILLARQAFENLAEGTVSTPPTRDSSSIGDIRTGSQIPADRHQDGTTLLMLTQARPGPCQAVLLRARLDTLPGASPRRTWRLPVTHLPRPGL